MTMGDEKTRIATKRDTDPGSLHRQIKGDLDWITLKAIARVGPIAMVPRTRWPWT